MIMPRHGNTNDPIRSDLVARIRREIQEGRYDTPEKLEIALLRLLADVSDGDEPELPPPASRPVLDSEPSAPHRRRPPLDPV
ncbi:MAG: hypothetical protein NZM31_11850 [Gemmatales bacterium]|nr:hypothetical protein [Gemmatales bacterium]MDW8387688.1 hypothetical protein [Gemmatales bacterium]